MRLMTPLILGLLWTSPALASSCMPPALEEAVKNADVIFKGTVTKVDFIEPRRADLMGDPSTITGDCGDKYVTFKVEKLWKGDVADEAMVYSSDGCVGLGGYFHVGDNELMFLNNIEEYGLSTFVCNGPDRKIEDAELEALLK